MPKAIIGLGSNLPSIYGDSVQTVVWAIKEINSLEKTSVTKTSYLYKSIPENIHFEDGEIVNDFINSTLEIETQLKPINLLNCLLNIEDLAQRKRHQNNNIKISRTLDLDLISYDNLHLKSEKLTLPHPKANERVFVKIPLANMFPVVNLTNECECLYNIRTIE